VKVDRQMSTGEAQVTGFMRALNLAQLDAFGELAGRIFDDALTKLAAHEDENENDV
jgi:hypothetical protein